MLRFIPLHVPPLPFVVEADVSLYCYFIMTTGTVGKTDANAASS